MIVDPTPALTFGPLNLLGTAADLSADGYVFEALGDDADWGNPVPIEQKIVSWLQDGAIVALQGYDNRELFVRVRVKAPDGNGLARGELALMLQTGIRNTLVVTPPADLAAACVFDVVMSHLEQVTDDLNGELQLQRTYGLRVTAEPFVRAAESVSVQAVPEFVSAGGSVTLTEVDSGSSATNWSMDPVRSGTVTSDGSKVTLNTQTTLAAATQGLLRSSMSADMTGMSYVRIKVSKAAASVYARWDPSLHVIPPAYTLSQSVTYLVNGSAVTPALTSGEYVYLPWSGGAGPLSSVEVRVAASQTGPTGPSGYGLAFQIVIDDIYVTDSATPSAGGGRQVSAAVDVAGSARTQGSLAVEYDTDPAPLGETLVYTCPDDASGYWPGMRDFTAGTAPTPTADTSLIADSWISIKSGAGGPWRVEYPIAQVPAGGFVLIARMRRASATGTSTVNITTGVAVGGTDVGPTQAASWTGTLSSSWEFHTLAALVLPAGDIGPDGVVWVELVSPAGENAVNIDEAWLFNIETGRLSWVELPATGTVSPSVPSRLWINAPTLNAPRPQLLVGTDPEAADGYHPGDNVKSMAVHEFIPPRAKVFVATTGSGGGIPAISLTHYPRSHTHVVAAS